MIKFSVPRLEKEPIDLSGTEPPEFLDLAENDPVKAVSEVRYDLFADKVSGGALVTGCCSVEIAADCGRCLSPVVFTLAAEKIELFLDLEDAGEEIDISEDIRSELLLELPMNIVCSEDCKGLCAQCGSNLNKKECNCNREPSGSPAWSELDALNL